MFRRWPPLQLLLRTKARRHSEASRNVALLFAVAFTSASLLELVPVVVMSSSLDGDGDGDGDDLCVADNSTTFAGAGAGFPFLPCKPPQQISPRDFSSHLLRNPSPFQANLGSAVNLASASNFPGLNTHGLSIARIDFLPNGLNPPHFHPRASELLFLVLGSLTVGFVTPNGTLFQQSLYAGDLFLFPRALPHFQLNPDDSKPAIAIAALNSQNPGVLQLAAALFATNPPFPHEVLQVSLGGVGQATVDNLTTSVEATLC